MVVHQCIACAFVRISVGVGVGCGGGVAPIGDVGIGGVICVADIVVAIFVV